MIPNRRCPYCQQAFQPSPYRLQQRVCSQAECQRRRRTDYHRQKIRTDPLYAQVVRDSRKQWQTEHADYQKTYWQNRRMPPAWAGAARLSDREIGLLTRWIEQGAIWQKLQTGGRSEGAHRRDPHSCAG